jgi:enterochelin esterase-like enzyme
MRFMKVILSLCVISATLAAQRAEKRMTDWVDPVREAPPLTRYKLFHSDLIHHDYSYLVYLPPDYDTATVKRYPSIYWLHGGGGNQRGGGGFVKLLDSAIRRGIAPPAIVFLLNGLGESCWIDSKDGARPVASIITKEMIPYFDRNYRTIPRREFRAIEGMSMGGWGTLRLGFAHNDLFAVVSALAPALVSEKDQPMKLPPSAFAGAMSGDLDYFRAHTGWTTAEQHAAEVRRATRLRIVVGDADTWTYGRCQEFSRLLDRLSVPHEMLVVPGVRHSYPDLYATLGDKAFDFYRTAFGAQQARSQMEQRRRQYMKDHAPQSSTGLIPLTDLGTGAYKGEEGGLYAGGKSVAPAVHIEAGLQLARQIAPMDGKIVLLAIGFSNPNIEFPGFQKLAAADREVNPRLVTVNGCVGGRASNVIADAQSDYWTIVDERLKSEGVTSRQVQALWIKEVLPGAAQFPEDARKLYRDLIGTLHIAHDRFPNAKVAYLSSRTYGGYTEVGGSPEPGAYETGFAVKWVVSDQIAGKPELNFDAAKGPVRSPWIEWGPYLWTDGDKGRKDSFVYLREDLREDGLHPSGKGQTKIAALLLHFFKTDPTTRPWFLK